MGKKRLQRGICLLLCGLLFAAGTGMTVRAAGAPARIKKLVGQMSSYELSYITFHNISSKKTVKLTEAQKARAAALSLPVSKLKPLKKGEFGYYVMWNLPKSKLRTASVNLFGKSVSISKLRKNPKQSDICYTGDAYRTKKGVPVVYYTDGETEMDYQVTKTSVSRKKGKSYKVTKYVYCGYWGNNRGKPNYKIVYTVAANKKSQYGYVIKSMAIQKAKS